jgi:CMP/dCMP kinase
MELDALSVAIDGPAGSGKSSVAGRVAEELGLTHVDTGAMYRALTWSALKDSVDLDDGAALTRRLEELDLGWKGDKLFVQGAPVSPAIRGADVTAQVSMVSAHAEVRRRMQRLQRSVSWQCADGVVMEGRDIGTVVLPLAPCKIYLEASVEERARRRAAQEGRALGEEELRAVAEDLERRDRLDSEREESPLQVSPDAHVVDTTALDLDQVVAECARIAEESRPREADRKVMDAIRFQHWHYRAFHRFLRSFLRIFFGVGIRGSGHEETPEGLIYACNHVSWWDPPVIGSSVGREVHFLAKKELFWGPLGWFISLFNAFPIERRRYDAVAFDRARALLKGGGNLLIFPEGTRRSVERPGPVKKGLGILAIQTGQPYLPCYVEGTPQLPQALFGRARVRAWIGPPIRLHALEHLRRTLSDRAIQDRISQLYLAQIHAFRHRATADQA